MADDLPPFHNMQPLQHPLMASIQPPHNLAPPFPLQPLQPPGMEPMQLPQDLAPPMPPPLVGTLEPPENVGPLPIPVQQYLPVLPPQQQSLQFIPVPSPPQFQPVGPVANTGLPPQPQQIQYPPSIQHLPPISGQAPPTSLQAKNNYTPGFGGLGAPLSSYMFGPPSYVQPAPITTVMQCLPMPQMHAPNLAGGQPGPSIFVNQHAGPVTPQQRNAEQSSVTAISVPTEDTRPITVHGTVWIDYISPDGRRYYYNRSTGISTWQKPYELFTPVERADASTNWKEHTNPEGRKYYYNSVTKHSIWHMPEEMKMVREQLTGTANMEAQSEIFTSSHVPSSVDRAPPTTYTSSSTAQGALPSLVLVASVPITGDSQSQSGPEAPALQVLARVATTAALEYQKNVNPTAAVVDTILAATNDSTNFSAQDVPDSSEKVCVEDKKETEKAVVIGEKVNNEEKAVTQKPVTYADKMEAKNAFKALLESANIGSDWTWERAMRVIINDRRYGVLRTLRQRKQVFDEFLFHKRKQEANERRLRQKRAREEFKIMLEESKELISSTRWSKAVSMFEKDERFKAVEQENDRRDLYFAYLRELGQKEREKAKEERGQNIREYRQFLESCDFIKPRTKWRKVQGQLEADERCSRLDAIDRLETFQDYLHDLVKKEEEQRKIQMEEQRKAERKNRDEFRKLLQHHAAAGILTAKIRWRDYYMKVKDLPAYLAVASNTSGLTPKELFEDMTEELEKQYDEDKNSVENAMRLKKVPLASTWTLEEFKSAIIEDISSPPVSDVNLKIIFDELVERAREEGEREAKRRRRLADNFLYLLYSIKDITASSNWEDSKALFQNRHEFSSVGDVSVCKQIFEEYITEMKEQEVEDERKRNEENAKREKERQEHERRKAKHKWEKEREHKRDRENKKMEAADTDSADVTETYTNDDDKAKKQIKRHHNVDDLNEIEKDRSKSFHGHGSALKRSTRQGSTSESDGESRHKKSKRDDHYCSGGKEGELGKDREMPETSDSYVMQAKVEKEREEERRQSEHKRAKQRGHEGDREKKKLEEADTESADITETHINDDDKDKKERKGHHNVDDLSEIENDQSKSFNGHSSDHQRSTRQDSTPESDGESRDKKNKTDNPNASGGNGDHGDELEEGELR